MDALVLARFEAKYVVRDDGCWEWTASRFVSGYGQFHYLRTRPAHIFAYEHHVGAVSDGLQLDHLCRNRACVNPQHLEPVTASENIRRSDHAQRRKRTCPNGHAYDAANTYTTPSGTRQCRTCRRDRAAAAEVARRRTCPGCGGRMWRQATRCQTCRAASDVYGGGRPSAHRDA